MTVPRPRVLIFEHMPGEHPRLFRDRLIEDGIANQAVRLDRGEPIPDLATCDALIVMGGPMTSGRRPSTHGDEGRDS